MSTVVRVLAALCLCLLFPATATAAEHARRPAARLNLSPEELYARRALRRARLIIELRLLQLRDERLECVRQAILRNLPPDLRPPQGASEGNRRPDPETCAGLFRYR